VFSPAAAVPVVSESDCDCGMVFLLYSFLSCCVTGEFASVVSGWVRCCCFFFVCLSVGQVKTMEFSSQCLVSHARRQAPPVPAVLGNSPSCDFWDNSHEFSSD